MYGLAFSKEVIDNEVLPQIPLELLPWLLKDRKEAAEGAYVKDANGKLIHDGQGLDKAEQMLKSVLARMGEGYDEKIKNFLLEQKSIATSKVEFYKSKLYLMDKIIEETKRK